MHRGKEMLKNIIIVLLFCSLMVLLLLAIPGGKAAAQRTVRTVLSSAGILPQDEPAAASYGTAARPVLISLRNEGGRSSVYGGELALDTAYEVAAPLFAKAFFTASEEQERTMSAFTAALRQTGVYLAFDGALPSEVLAAWLGAETTVCARPADSYLLSLSAGRVTLWLCGEQYFSYTTGLSADELRAAAEGSMDDGGGFACERGSALHPQTFLPGGAITLPGGQLSNPCTLSAAQEIASALEFNPYGSGAYVDIGGSFVFSESGRTCTVTQDGTVRFSAEAGQYDAYAATAETAAGYIDAAQLVLGAVSADRIGDARWSLCGYQRTETGASCTFRYHYQGLPVLPRTATVIFTGSRLTSLTVPVCTFTAAENGTLPLPPAQAEILAPENARLRLVYRSAADGSLNAEWEVLP